MRLTIDPKNRSATVAYVYEREDPFNLIAELQALHISKSAQRISERTIDGQVCVGFRVDEPTSVLWVWVSPQTLLPVFAQRTTENLPAPPGEDKVDKVKVVARFADLRFDEPLADELFSVQPPPDYRLIEIGKLQCHLGNVTLARSRVGHSANDLRLTSVPRLCHPCVQSTSPADAGGRSCPSG